MAFPTDVTFLLDRLKKVGDGRMMWDAPLSRRDMQVALECFIAGFAEAHLNQDTLKFRQGVATAELCDMADEHLSGSWTPFFRSRLVGSQELATHAMPVQVQISPRLLADCAHHTLSILRPLGFNTAQLMVPDIPCNACAKEDFGSPRGYSCIRIVAEQPFTSMEHAWHP